MELWKIFLLLLCFICFGLSIYGGVIETKMQEEIEKNERRS